MSPAEREYRAAAMAEWRAWQLAYGGPWESPLHRERHEANCEVSPDLRCALAAASAAYDKAQSELAAARAPLVDEAEDEIGRGAPWWTFGERRESAESRVDSIYEEVKREWQLSRDALWEQVKHEFGF